MDPKCSLSLGLRAGIRIQVNAFRKILFIECSPDKHFQKLFNILFSSPVSISIGANLIVISFLLLRTADILLLPQPLEFNLKNQKQGVPIKSHGLADLALLFVPQSQNSLTPRAQCGTHLFS